MSEVLYRIKYQKDDETHYVTTQVSPKGIYWTEAACKGVITSLIKRRWRYKGSLREDFSIEKWQLIPYED